MDMRASRRGEPHEHHFHAVRCQRWVVPAGSAAKTQEELATAGLPRTDSIDVLAQPAPAFVSARVDRNDTIFVALALTHADECPLGPGHDVIECDSARFAQAQPSAQKELDEVTVSLGRARIEDARLVGRTQCRWFAYGELRRRDPERTLADGPALVGAPWRKVCSVRKVHNCLVHLLWRFPARVHGACRYRGFEFARVRSGGMERETGLEPATTCLGSRDSTN